MSTVEGETTDVKKLLAALSSLRTEGKDLIAWRHVAAAVERWSRSEWSKLALLAGVRPEAAAASEVRERVLSAARQLGEIDDELELVNAKDS